MTTYKDKQYCDAETGKPGHWRTCGRRATIGILTFKGSVLHYCDRHKERVNDPEHRYHDGVQSKFDL